MNGTNYRKYMRSRAWLKKRDQAYRVLGRKCQICGVSSRLQVHHKTYERLGSERISDLQVLCKDCHANHHEGEVDGCYDPITKEYLALGL